MTTTDTQTALVTGANSGLGFEAAAQLAEQGYSKVIISARTEEKAEAARTELQTRTGKDVFDVVALENNDRESVEAAATAVASMGKQIDFLLLNAGVAPTTDLTRTSEGIEATVAASLVGHHRLTVRLLEQGLLSEKARIVIAGSEAARGDVPTMNPVDIDAFAATHFDGDLEAAIESQILMQPPSKYNGSNTYATTKLFVAWWAAELARRLPNGITVNAVSPGSTPNTNATRNAPLYMRALMMPILKLIPGMSHTIETGAARYLEAAGYGNDQTGKFFASKPKKMTGPLTEIQMDHFDNLNAQRALWAVTAKIGGDFDYPSHADKQTSKNQD